MIAMDALDYRSNSYLKKLSVCMCVCVRTPQECVGPWRPGKGIGSSESGVTVFVSN